MGRVSKTADVEISFVLELGKRTGKHCRTAIAGKSAQHIEFASSPSLSSQKTPQNLFLEDAMFSLLWAQPTDTTNSTIPHREAWHVWLGC